MRRSGSSIGRNGIIALAILLGVVAHADATRALDWKQIDGGATDISMAPDGTIWALGAGTNLLRRDLNGQWANLGGGALRVSGASATTAWVANQGGELWVSSNGQWTRICPGPAAQETSGVCKGVGKIVDVSADSGGGVWLVNDKGTFFYGIPQPGVAPTFRPGILPSGVTITRVAAAHPPGTFKYGALGYVIDSSGKVYQAYSEGGNLTVLAGKSAPPLMRDVALRRYGSVLELWSVTSEGNLAMIPLDSYSLLPTTWVWQNPGGPTGLTAIGAGPEVVAVNNSGGISLSYVPAATSAASALDWKQIDGSAYDIAMAPEGTIWALGAGSNLLRRHPNEQWTNLGGGALRVSSASSTTAFVANQGGELWVSSNSQWTRICPGPAEQETSGVCKGVGKIVDVSADSGGGVWLVNDKGAFFYGIPQPGVAPTFRPGILPSGVTITRVAAARPPGTSKGSPPDAVGYVIDSQGKAYQAVGGGNLTVLAGKSAPPLMRDVALRRYGSVLELWFVTSEGNLAMILLDSYSLLPTTWVWQNPGGPTGLTAIGAGLEVVAVKNSGGIFVSYLPVPTPALQK